jgi:hypothetical protein
MSETSKAWAGERVRKWLESRSEAARVEQAAADRRSHRRYGLAEATIPREAGGARRIAPIDHFHLQPRLERARRVDKALRRRRQVCFREDDHRPDTHLAREHETTFETCDVEILIGGRDDERSVDVRDNELDPALVARGGPLKQAGPIESAHQAAGVTVGQQPVANGGSVLRSRLRGKPEENEPSNPSPETVTLPR